MKTDFGKVVFNEKWHTYSYDGQKLASVTSTANRLKPPFDQQGQAERYADRHDMSIEDVLADWERKREEGQRRGNLTHKYITDALEERLQPVDDQFLALNERLPEMTAFDGFWRQVSGLMALAAPTEWIIGDAELGIAGRADALFKNSESGLVHYWDWKTGKQFTTDNRFPPRMFAPFDDLDNCDLVNHSIQASLYRLIVERNTDFEVGDSYILFLSRDGQYEVHKALDLRERLLGWLNVNHP